MRRLLALFLLTLLLWPGAPARAAETKLTARAYALIEAGSGRLLLGQNEGTRLPMASTTKIMTALVAIEAGGDFDRLVTVPKEAAGTEGSSMYLSAGERVSLRDLLYGLMLVSGNDAAVTIAIHIAGSVEAFAQRMNQRAASLGCQDTHFTNPNGLHAPDHYTTALDLARIAAAAMREPFFRKLVSTAQYTTATGDHVRHLRSKNRFLTEVEGGCGVKTGYTKKAGRCLCFAAEREGMLLIGTVLNAPDMWNDAKAILERGFAAFELRPFLTAGEEAGTIPVTGSDKKALPAAAKEGILYPVRKDGKDETELQIRLQDALTAPVPANAPAGEARLLVNGQAVKAVPLITREAAEELTFRKYFHRVMEAYLAS